MSNSINIEMTEYLLKKSRATSVTSDSSAFSDDPNVTYEFINLSIDPKDIKKRRNSSFHRIKSIFIDYADKHQLEQSFLLKLDFFLLTSATLGYSVKYLNQNNMSTAYINGMDEYYHMDKNQYNYLNTFWSIGYFLGQIGSAYLLHKFPPRLFLGTLEIIWGLLTLSMVYSKDLNSVYIVRFLVGVTESAFFPSMEYLLGSWYTSEEITKRSTLFALSSSFSRIITGPIQVLILKYFDDEQHTRKFEPFQYLFLFDVIVSIPVGVLTMFFNPDTPATTKNWYWNRDDRLVALERRRRLIGDDSLISNVSSHNKTNFTWENIKLFLKQGEIYLFPLVFICYNNTGLNTIALTTYLRDELKYSPTVYNIYPSVIGALSMVVALTVGYLSDYFKGQKNYVFIVSYFFAVSVGSFILAFYWDNISVSFHIFLYFLISVPGSYGQPQIFSWINRTLAHDDLKRHFAVVVTNTIPYLTSVVHIIVWDTRSQPRFQLGYIYNTVLATIGIFGTFITLNFTIKKFGKPNVLTSRYGSDENLGAIIEED